MSGHIEQLTEWWENAEKGPVAQGDTVIKRHPDGRYTIREAEEGWESTNYRILARAPKPKPAWHDAPAVIAHTGIRDRRVFVNALDGEWLDADTGALLRADTLQAPVPLIEAKVTDEMARTVLDNYYEVDDDGHNWPADTVALMRLAITAALGLETE